MSEVNCRKVSTKRVRRSRAKWQQKTSSVHKSTLSTDAGDSADKQALPLKLNRKRCAGNRDGRRPWIDTGA